MSEIEKLKMQLECAHENMERMVTLYTDELNFAWDQNAELREEVKSLQSALEALTLSTMTRESTP